MKPLGVGVGLALIVLFFHIADFRWDDVWLKLRQGGWRTLGSVVLFTVLLYAVSAVKWSIIIRDLNPGSGGVPLGSLFRYLSVGYFFGLFIPQAMSDVIVRGVALKRSHRLSLRAGTYTVLIDQITNMAVALLFLLPALLHFSKIVSPAVSAALVVVSAVLLAGAFRLSNRWLFTLFGRGYLFAISLVRRLPFLKGSGPDPGLAEMDFVLSAPAALRVIGWSLLRNLVLATRLYGIVWIMDLRISFFTLLLCSSVMAFVALIALIPGQLGLGEMGWYALLLLSGAPDPDIVVFVVSSRIFSNLAIIAVGMAVWLGSAPAAASAREEGGDPAAVSAPLVREPQ